MTTTAAEQQMSNGIDALIERLKQEGVAQGEAQARKIVSNAENKAKSVLAEAEAQAKQRLTAARRETEQLQRGGEEALKVAMRDAVLQLKELISVRFAEQVGALISKLTTDEDLLRKMILAVASRARTESGMDSAAQLELILPRSVASLEELRRNPKELRDGPLSQLVFATAADMLREGVSFSFASDNSGGISVVMKGDGVEVDLTDQAVANVILRHLQPRFRALLEGVVN